jgi:hypothetical protein
MEIQMKNVMALILSTVLTTSALAQISQSQGSSVIKDVVCSKAGQVTHFCTIDEMKLLIDGLRAAKSAGEKSKLTLGQQAHTLGKGLFVIGGSWFASSVLISFLDDAVGIPVTESLITAMDSLISLNFAGGSAFPKYFVEGVWANGIFIGLPMAAVGAAVMLVTPSTLASDTVSDFYTHDENFGRLLEIDDNYILSLVQQDSKLGNKIVAIAAVVLTKASQKK